MVCDVVQRIIKKGDLCHSPPTQSYYINKSLASFHLKCQHIALVAGRRIPDPRSLNLSGPGAFLNGRPFLSNKRGYDPGSCQNSPTGSVSTCRFLHGVAWIMGRGGSCEAERNHGDRLLFGRVRTVDIGRRGPRLFDRQTKSELWTDHIRTQGEVAGVLKNQNSPFMDDGRLARSSAANALTGRAFGRRPQRLVGSFTV